MDYKSLSVRKKHVMNVLNIVTRTFDCISWHSLLNFNKMISQDSTICFYHEYHWNHEMRTSTCYLTKQQFRILASLVSHPYTTTERCTYVLSLLLKQNTRVVYASIHVLKEMSVNHLTFGFKLTNVNANVKTSIGLAWLSNLTFAINQN